MKVELHIPFTVEGNRKTIEKLVAELNHALDNSACNMSKVPRKVQIIEILDQLRLEEKVFYLLQKKQHPHYPDDKNFTSYVAFSSLDRAQKVLRYMEELSADPRDYNYLWRLEKVNTVPGNVPIVPEPAIIEQDQLLSAIKQNYVPQRVLERILRYGIWTLADLAGCSESSLYTIKGVGKTKVNMFRDLLLSCELTFKADDELN